jgi:hypothetical protein
MWNLDADLVTLSACETGLGKKDAGEGYLGFSQALFVAGARSLLVSLWKVDDLCPFSCVPYEVPLVRLCLIGLGRRLVDVECNRRASNMLW